MEALGYGKELSEKETGKKMRNQGREQRLDSKGKRLNHASVGHWWLLLSCFCNFAERHNTVFNGAMKESALDWLELGVFGEGGFMRARET